ATTTFTDSNPNVLPDGVVANTNRAFLVTYTAPGAVGCYRFTPNGFTFPVSFPGANLAVSTSNASKHWVISSSGTTITANAQTAPALLAVNEVLSINLTATTTTTNGTLSWDASIYATETCSGTPTAAALTVTPQANTNNVVRTTVTPTSV